MNKILTFINDSDQKSAINEFERQWQLFPWYKRYLTLIFPAAAKCLELKYPSPHNLKYHHTLWKMCENLTGETAKFLLKRYIQYICRRARFIPPLNPPSITGSLNAKSSLTGLHDSLEERAFHNALYYLMKLRQEKGFLLPAMEILRKCAAKIDPLGHHFTCPHGIIEAGLVSERINETYALTALLDYTFKFADLTPFEFKKPRQSFDNLLHKTAQAPGLLGHNLIFAHRIDCYADSLGENWRPHLQYYLEKNMENKSPQYTAEMIDSIPTDEQIISHPLRRLRQAILNSDIDLARSIIVQSSKSLDFTADIFPAMIAIMACVNLEEAHFYTYPLAVKEMSQKYPQLSTQLYCGWSDFIISFAGQFGWIDQTEEILRLIT